MLLTAAMCVSVLAACGSETKETAAGETSADSHSTSGDRCGKSGGGENAANRLS